KAIHRVVEMCFLETVLYQSVETLSKGFRHRTCFAQSIIHDPDVLVMDEPTDGLDPNQKHEVRGLVKRMGEKKAIVFSTHILEEVEAACTRAIIIDRGKIVANGTPEQLKQRSEHAGVISLRLAGVPVDDAKQKLSQLPGVKRTAVIKEGPPVAHLRLFPQSRERNGEVAQNVADLAARERWRIEELHVEEGRLDEVFRSITRPDTTPEVAKP